MNKKNLKNVTTLKFSNNTFSGGFMSLSAKQMSKINGGETNSGCSNESCRTGSNNQCSNTVICSGSNNTGCTNSGGYCSKSVPK